MIAQYGYRDGSGTYYISIDTDKCDGCVDYEVAKCVEVCPAGVFEVVDEDPNDPLRDEPVAIVKEEHRNKLRFSCAQCKPASGYKVEDLPCVKACPNGAISHSW